MKAGPDEELIASIADVMRCLVRARFFAVVLFALSAVAGIAQAGGVPALTTQIKETMAKARTDKTVDARTEAAEHLASLTRKISSKEVTEALVTDITSLLDSPDDSVRYWVATALGNLGPAARSLRGRGGEVTSRPKPSNNVPTTARLAPEP